MTLKTSWFDKGIYTNTLRRFKWGSLLYFVMLFFSVPFVILMSDYHRLYPYRYGPENQLINSIILEADYIILPFILAMAVPTVVAVLLHRYMHSSKQGIAVHALPVTRKANYISTQLAGLTLMAVPVLANTLILLVMSLAYYSFLFPAWTVLYWAAINLSVLIIMFSAATFTAFLTGNAAAHIAINAIFHAIPALISLVIYLVSDIFLYGFVESENFIAIKIVLNSPVVWLCQSVAELTRKWFFNKPQIWIFLAVSAVLYILGYILYKKRKVENCGDVAAFKVFRPILKYGVTAIVAICSLGIMAYSGNLFATVVVTAVCCSIAYFAVEMLMHKTLKVFDKYKGLIGFGIVTVGIICFCAFTNMFGYETRVPDKAEVAKAAIHTYNDENIPFVADDTLIDNVIRLHKERLQRIPVYNQSEYKYLQSWRYVNISYELKNGKHLNRRYCVADEVYNGMMSTMYENPEYKYKVKRFDTLNIDNIEQVTLVQQARGESIDRYIFTGEEAKELMRTIKKDVARLSYKEIEQEDFPMYFDIEISHTAKENESIQVFDPKVYGDYPEDAKRDYTWMFGITVNGNYMNTLNFLKEKGYYDKMVDFAADNMYIGKVPFNIDEEGLINYKDDAGDEYEFLVNFSDLAAIEHEDAVYEVEKLLCNASESEEYKEGVNYYAIYISPEKQDALQLCNKATWYSKNKLPEYLKIYVTP